MPKLPVISGKKLIKLLAKLDYEIISQRGSHVKLRKNSKLGEQIIIVPDHREISKGTLNDIISRVSLFNNLSRDEIIELIKKV